MPARFPRPIRRPADAFDRLVGSADAAEAARVAHVTAAALLRRVRADESGEAVDRMLQYTREHGIDDIAEMWSHAASRSLPGALWRLYLLRLAIHSDPALAALLHERGTWALTTIDAAVAGAPVPAGPSELIALIDTILRGAFVGDFAGALERAAAFCRVQASGATHVADDYEATESQRATALTRRALRLDLYGDDLAAAASLWRQGALV
ncbi:DNA-directed RNA polymerase subunit beta [Microbacterium sp. YY-01]|uniref:DNA-directed RNA polymerase subunit beta n=1 Tax=Microbacterium sp. YY-01 TaxID=3421634 RepID=UPI003D16F26F